MHLLLGKAVALQFDKIEPGQARRAVLARGNAEGNNVGGNPRALAGRGIGADAHALVYGGQIVEVGVIADADMAGELHLHAEGNVIAEFAVVSHVAARHQDAMRSDPGQAVSARRTGTETDEFVNDRAVTDDEAGVLTAIFRILRSVPDRGPRENLASRSKGRASGHDRAGVQYAMVANL